MIGTYASDQVLQNARRSGDLVEAISTAGTVRPAESVLAVDTERFRAGDQEHPVCATR